MALPPGFELEQAAPPQQSAGMKLPPGFQMESGGGGMPGPRRAWSDVPGEALANVGPSAINFYKGLVTAITSPVQTATGILDIGAGALQNLLPKSVVDLVNQIDTNPAAAKRAIGADRCAALSHPEIQHAWQSRTRVDRTARGASPTTRGAYGGVVGAIAACSR